MIRVLKKNKAGCIIKVEVIHCKKQRKESRMKLFSQTGSNKIKRLPSYLLYVFIAILVVLALIVLANNLMQYIAVKQENEKLEQIRDNKLLELDELKYYVNTEIDDEYRERMARLLGYCYPDEIIYYVE